MTRAMVLSVLLLGLMRPGLPADGPGGASAPAVSPTPKPILLGSIVVEHGSGGSVIIVRKDSDAIACSTFAHGESICYGACSNKPFSRWKCVTVDKAKNAPVAKPVSMAKQ